MGAFPSGFVTNFSWLSAMLDASKFWRRGIGSYVPCKNRFFGFLFFFKNEPVFRTVNNANRKKTWKPVKPHPSSLNRQCLCLYRKSYVCFRMDIFAVWKCRLPGLIAASAGMVGTVQPVDEFSCRQRVTTEELMFRYTCPLQVFGYPVATFLEIGCCAGQSLKKTEISRSK